MKELALSFGFTENEAAEAIAEMMKGTVQTMFSNLSKQEVLDLIPVKPLGEHESNILKIYDEKLTGLYTKLKS